MARLWVPYSVIVNLYFIQNQTAGNLLISTYFLFLSFMNQNSFEWFIHESGQIKKIQIWGISMSALYANFWSLNVYMVPELRGFTRYRPIISIHKAFNKGAPSPVHVQIHKQLSLHLYTSRANDYYRYGVQAWGHSLGSYWFLLMRM